MLRMKSLLNALAQAYVMAMTGELGQKWQALIYCYHRSLCEAIEAKYPGIAGDAGFDYALGVLANLPKVNPNKATA